jgi:hypothetical protein
MTGAEAAGELVTGALVAGAVERQSGERNARPSGLCLNCGSALLGGYCHRCGQAENIHRSLAALWHDIAHSVLHFEGKIWNTLPLLAWRPGELTRRYIHGERARFVSPMALFLFSVFLMFALFSAIGAHFEVPENKPPTEAARAAAQTELPKLQAGLARLKQQRAGKSDADRAALEQRIDRAAEEVGNLKRVANWQAPRITDFQTGWKRLDKGLQKANENPNLLLYKVQSSAYKFSWALIPLSVPFVWLLYAWKRQYRIYDHAVFVTYSLSFMSLLVIALTLANKLGAPTDVITLAAMIIPPVHIYRQLRGAYGTRRRWAVARASLLSLFAGLCLIVFALLLLGIGAVG